MADITGATSPIATSSSEQTVSNYAAPYVSDLLSSAATTAAQGYQPYSGAQVAGPSDLQSAAFQGIGGLTIPSAPTTAATGTLSNVIGGLGNLNKSVSDYMNPYLQNVVDVQAAEARRQAAIQNAANAKQFVNAGAFGGDRQALMQSELQRNLATQIGNIEATGLKNAYDEAQKQRMAELGLAGTTAAQLGNLGLYETQQGLAANKQAADLGSTQRDITQQGLTSDYQNFLEQRDWDKTQQQYMANTLKQLPMTTTNVYGQMPSIASSAVGGALTAAQLYNLLFPSDSNTSGTTTAPKK
jgi:hypothetical protein